jgi:hypothetical protein
MSDRLVPGEGVLPLADVLAAVIDESGPERVGIEVFSSRLRNLPGEEAARLVRDATTAVLHTIGCSVR